MQNFELLNYDESCCIIHRLFHWGDYFKFPVVYQDGFATYKKQNFTKEHGAVWGFICDGYIISINPAPDEQTPEGARKYCKGKTFLGRPYCFVPRSVMETVFDHVFGANDLIKAFSGEPFKSKWYMSQNDKWGSTASGAIEEKLVLGVHPQISDGGSSLYLSETTKTPFYPAVRV